MKRALDDVAQFHDLAGQPIGESIPTYSDNFMGIVSDELADLAKGLRKRAASERFAKDSRLLRAALMLEELAETINGLNESEEAEVADGLADLVFVALGTAVTYGIPLDAVWNAVVEANLAKFPRCTREFCDNGMARVGVWESQCTECNGKGRTVIRDESGKVMKPEGWKAPDIAGVLEAARNNQKR